jgi:hypothetical protein
MDKSKEKNQTSSKGMQERMQNVYFEFLPPIEKPKPATPADDGTDPFLTLLSGPEG